METMKQATPAHETSTQQTQAQATSVTSTEIQEIDCAEVKLSHSDIESPRNREILRNIYHYFSAAKNVHYIVITSTYLHPHPDFATKFNILLYHIEKNCWERKQVVDWDKLDGRTGIPWSWHAALNSKNGDLHIICSYRYMIYNIDTEQLKMMPDHGMGIPNGAVRLIFIPIGNNNYELNLYGVHADTIHCHSIYRSVDNKVIDLRDRIQNGINYRCHLFMSNYLWIPMQKQFIIFGDFSVDYKIYFLDNSLTSQYNTKISDIKEAISDIKKFKKWSTRNTVLLYGFIVMRIYYNSYIESGCIWFLNLFNNKWYESRKKINPIYWEMIQVGDEIYMFQCGHFCKGRETWRSVISTVKMSAKDIIPSDLMGFMCERIVSYWLRNIFVKHQFERNILKLIQNYY
eukprot:57686_1